jgi:hypothetical protein
MAFPGSSTRIRALSIIVRRGARIGGEPALLEPYARVPIVIDRQDATHGYPLDVDSACRRSPPKKGQPFTQSRGGFCPANQRTTATLPQIAELSALYSA